MKINSLAFLLGIGSLFLLAELPKPFTVLAIFIIGILLALANYRAALVFTLGLVYAWALATHGLETRLPEQYSGQYIKVVGTIIDISKTSPVRTQFSLKIQQATINNNSLKLNKIRLSWYDNQINLQIGQILQLTAKLKSPHGMFNNAGFDYERWLLANKYDATGYVVNKLPVVISIAPPSLTTLISDFRRQIKQNYIAGTSNFALINALLLGDRVTMTKQHWQILRNTGTGHLIAISGLHLGLVGLMFLLLFRQIFIWFGNSFVALNSLFIATLLAILITMSYAALAGFSIPTQRAFIMLTIAGIGLLITRKITASQLFSLALISCLLINPFYVLSAGFYLSFMAVLLILIMPKHGNKLLLLIWLQVVLGLGLIPLLNFFGFGVSLVSLPANLIAVPVMSFIILPSLILGLVFSWLFNYFELSNFLLNIADYSLGLLWDYLTILGHNPQAWQHLPQINIWQTIIASFGFLLLLMPAKFPMKTIGLLMFVVGLVPNFAQSNLLKSGLAKITTLDVGQGLAILIETRHHNLLFDVASKKHSTNSIFKLTIEQLLINKHIKSLDKLIISHADNDHAGGFQDVIQSLAVREILSSTPSKFTNAKNCNPQTWYWDEVKFAILHPPINHNLSANNGSCVLLITAQNKTMLILADIEAKAELTLLKNNPKLSAQIILVAHHGSKTSSSETLLQTLQPQIGIISAGYKNRYRHPHKLVIERLLDYKMQIFNTADSGAIEVLLADKIVVKKYRDKYGRFWHKPAK